MLSLLAFSCLILATFHTHSAKQVLIDINKHVKNRCGGRVAPANQLFFDCDLTETACVSLNNYTDCKVNCANGLDEACHLTQFRCDRCKCIPHDMVMDGKFDCLDQTDEMQTVCDVNAQSCADDEYCVPIENDPGFQCIPLENYQVSLGFVLDSTASMDAFSKPIIDAIDHSIDMIDRTTNRRVKNYILVGFGDDKAKLLEDTEEVSRVRKRIQSWLPDGGVACLEKTLAGIKQALERVVTKRCVIYVFTDGGADDDHRLDELMDDLAERQCQVNFVLNGGCGSPTDFDLYHDIAAMTNGQVYLLESSRPPAPQYEDVRNVMESFLAVPYPHVLLATSNAPEEEKIMPITVDPGVKEMWISATSCVEEIVLRDQNGVEHTIDPASLPPNIESVADQGDMFQVVRVKDPRASQWLLTVDRSAECRRAAVRVWGSGFPQYDVEFAIGNAKIDRPVYGVAHNVKVLMSKPHKDGYDANKLDVVGMDDRHGNTAPLQDVGEFADATVNRILLPDKAFMARISGEALDGHRFVRYSFAPVIPRVIDVDALASSEHCSDLEFYCGEDSDDTCIPFSNYRDCSTQCSNGADEACPEGTVKCRGTCGCADLDSAEAKCYKRELEKYCEHGTEYHGSSFECHNGGCVPHDWVMDGINDCGDNSDEAPGGLDECALEKDDCDVQATCTDIADGAYFCTCRFGYQGDGFQCTKAARTTTTTSAPDTTHSDMSSTKTPVVITGDPVTDGLNSDKCPGQFDCGGGHCIDITQFRDCVEHCPNGEDEMCITGQILCDGCGKCVWPEEVDSKCESRRLDVLCENHFGVFPCRDGDGCVIYQFVLDGVEDCKDGSDEDYRFFDECWLERDNCDDVNAVCLDSVAHPLNTQGRAECLCKYGYFSDDDGQHCINYTVYQGEPEPYELLRSLKYLPAQNQHQS